MRYFDASALAKRYLQEDQSPLLRSLLDQASCTSRLSEVEVASALRRRTREGSLPFDERDRLLGDLDRDLDAMMVVEMTSEVTALAREILGRHGLRASDAIHLASCLALRLDLDADIPFVAFDARLRDAAIAEGLPVEP